MPFRKMIVCISFLAAALSLRTEGPVTIDVDASAPSKPFNPSWAFVGYDEPNYSYAPNGVKLLRELSDLSPVPVYVRAHNLLTSGDGSYSLKWGSTNAYTEDAAGRPVYNWTIVDRIFMRTSWPRGARACLGHGRAKVLGRGRGKRGSSRARRSPRGVRNRRS